MNKKAKLVLVDDDQDFLLSLKQLLEYSDYSVDAYETLTQLKDNIQKLEADILLLDVNLQQESSLDLLPTFRADTNLGLILISGSKAYETRLKSLELGADAYLSKPVQMRELQAIINSLYQRLNSQQTQSWSLDHTSWVIQSPDNHRHPLTENEYIFVNMIMEASGAPVKKEDLLKAMGKNDTPDEAANLQVLVSRLRKKVTKNSGEQLPIRVYRSLGYGLTPT